MLGSITKIKDFALITADLKAAVSKIPDYQNEVVKALESEENMQVFALKIFSRLDISLKKRIDQAEFVQHIKKSYTDKMQDKHFRKKYAKKLEAHNKSKQLASSAA